MALHPMQHCLYCPHSELEDLVKRLVMVYTNERCSFLTGSVKWLTFLRAKEPAAPIQFVIHN